MKGVWLAAALLVIMFASPTWDRDGRYSDKSIAKAIIDRLERP